VDSLKKAQKANEISEDTLKTLEAEIQKFTDKYIADVDFIVDRKSKEILSV